MKFFIVLCTLVAAVAADVSHLAANQYLPPTQSVAQSYEVDAASAPAVSYSAPAPSYNVEAVSAPAVSYETASYETAASEPAHSYSSDEGYRYKTNRRRVYRHRVRRQVSGEYLPPIAHYESAPAISYAAPAASYSAPAVAYSAPAVAYSAPSVAYSAPAVSYSAPVASYSAPAASYSAPAASYSSYETAAYEPSYSYSSNDGYRYKTAKRRVIRRRRN